MADEKKGGKPEAGDDVKGADDQAVEAPAAEEAPKEAVPALEDAPKKASTPVDDDAPVSTDGIEADEDALHSVGLFMAGDAEHVDIDNMDLPPELEEPSFADQARNVTSWVIFALTVAVAIGGIIHVNSTEELRIQVELLFRGGLIRHKRADIIELKEKYAKEDTYAQNRYGEFKMIYSPQDAEVSVVMLKYKENISDFMTRYVKGIGDKRTLIETRELKKFKQLTGNLKEKQIVTEQTIKNLPVTSRTNPKDAGQPDRPKACTDSKEDYCSFVYKIKISKEMYRPREFVVFSEYSLDPPNIELDEKTTQQLLFKNTGPGIYEVMWPGADLQPTPALFRQQFVRVMTDRLKCKLGPEDYKSILEIKDFAALMELSEDERWQKLSDNGLLSHGPPTAKAWTLMEWKSSVAELRQAENLELWTTAELAINNCACDPEAPKKCWEELPGVVTP
ncbi:MAG: hypothetical protein ACI9WU_005308 [Myxococcota bacterium]|jgi:hypothetical protein